MAKRLAIFSDIYANLPAMEVVAEHIRRGKYDGVYSFGAPGGYCVLTIDSDQTITEQIRLEYDSETTCALGRGRIASVLC